MAYRPQPPVFSVNRSSDLPKERELEKDPIFKHPNEGQPLLLKSLIDLAMDQLLRRRQDSKSEFKERSYR
eukprot:911469-Amorphochlora_amoeboformis.AAC.1